MNYVDRLALDVYRRTGGTGHPDATEMLLYRFYAVLVLTAGERVTNEMVHDAWSAWTATSRPAHRSLVPFAALTREVQDLDAPYRDAIRAVAATINQRSAA